MSALSIPQHPMKKYMDANSFRDGTGSGRRCRCSAQLSPRRAQSQAGRVRHLFPHSSTTIKPTQRLHKYVFFFLYSIPDWLLHRMLLNNAVSAVVGFVPFVGDIVIAAFKANSRNAALLEEYLRIRGAEILKAQAEHADASTSAEGQNQAVPGPAQPQKKSIDGWFSRRTKSKEQVPAAPSVAPSGSSVDRGRFVEDVPGGETSKQQ